MTGRATGTPWLVDGVSGNPLAPPSVVSALKAVDPRLDLQYHIGMRAFMVTLRWPEDDPRRQMIRDGHVAPHADFSILAPVPSDVSLDELAGWIEVQLMRVSQNDADVRQMLQRQADAIAKQNAAVSASVAEAARNDFIESVANPAPKGGRRRTKVA